VLGGVSTHTPHSPIIHAGKRLRVRIDLSGADEAESDEDTKTEDLKTETARAPEVYLLPSTRWFYRCQRDGHPPREDG